MRTRPIFHSSDAAIRGHVFCSFLALALQKHLDDLLRQAGITPEWKDLLRDLDRLPQVRIRHRGADWLVRTDASPAVAALFKRAHIALPPRAHQARTPAASPAQIRPENAAVAPGVVPRQLEFRQNANNNQLLAKIQVFKSGLSDPRRRAPIPGQQVADPPGGMIGQARQHVGKPGLRIDVVELGGLDQGVDGGGAAAAFVRAGEGPVVAADRDAAQGPLGGVVGHAQAAIVEEASERRPALEAVVDRLGGVALR